MTYISRQESVLLAIALFLISGVIIFNIFVSKMPSEEVKGTQISTSKVSETRVPSNSVQTTKQTSSENEKININNASIDELMKLQGIGQVKAEAIIKFREENGPFPTVKSLTNVSGIGEKTLEKIIDQITVE